MVSKVLAFESLNLRFNPFGELSIEEWLSVSFVKIEHLIKPLGSPNTAVQFLADHGRGKTTHLLKLYQEFSNAPYIKLYYGEKIPNFSKSKLTFIDSIENIKPNKRKKIYKITDSIAFTSHIDLSKELELYGYNVLTQKVSCNCNNNLLNIFNARIELARNKSGELPFLEMSKIKQLRKVFNNDIRSMQDQLYNEFQKLKEIKNA